MVGCDTSARHSEAVALSEFSENDQPLQQRRDTEARDLALLMITDPAQADRIPQLQPLPPRQRRRTPLPERRPQLIRSQSRGGSGILLRHAIE